MIGVGRIGLAGHLDAVLGSPRANLRAVWTRTARRFSEIDTLLGGPLPWKADPRHVISADDVDAVIILAPAYLHAPFALEAIAAGKPALIEKPLAATYPGAADVVMAAQRTGTPVGVAFQRRLSPPVQFARQVLRDGVIGDLITITAETSWSRPESYYTNGRGTFARDGGGVLINQGIHSIDLLQYLVGPTEQVFAFGCARTHQVESEDTVVVSMRLKDGVLATLQCTTSAGQDHDYRICATGTHGMITLTPGVGGHRARRRLGDRP